MPIAFVQPFLEGPCINICIYLLTVLSWSRARLMSQECGVAWPTATAGAAYRRRCQFGEYGIL